MSKVKQQAKAGMAYSAEKASKFSQAIAGALTGFASSLITAATEGGGVSINEWWVILGMTVLGGTAVYKVDQRVNR